MRRLLSLSFFAVLLAAFAVAAVQAGLEERQGRRSARSHADALLTGMEDALRVHYQDRHFDQIERLVQRIRERSSDELRVIGAGLCPEQDPQGIRVLGYPSSVDWESACRMSATKASTASASTVALDWSQRTSDGRNLYLARTLTLPEQGNRALRVILVSDISDLRKQWMSTFARTLGLTLAAGIAVLLALSLLLRRWYRTYQGFLHHVFRDLIAGRRPSFRRFRQLGLGADGADPTLSHDIQQLTAKILTLPRRDAAPAKTETDPPWLVRLKKLIGNRTPVVVANREPYIHQRKGDKIEVVRPASGLVTALEPILRHAGGMWIGHGSGSADRECSNEQGEVAVPPNKPSYTLKRVWLTPEEEKGYYYGFANEGLWPLCHLAHNRPVFRLNDWEHYNAVNRKFAEETPLKLFDDSSLMLVQDYHFALLPRMMRDRASRLGRTPPRISLFWHIPWPNPEAFGICPWNQDLLTGMLGADVIGFHTQYHCNNFLETCDRYLQARIDWENFSVTMGDHETLIRAFPIGIDTSTVRSLSDPEVRDLKERYGIVAEKIAVGVDRLDYTKGIVERVEAVERFLEKHPEWIGRFSLVQMGSPSRTHIPAYRHLAELLDETVARVNAKFAREGIDPRWNPIVLLASHHEWDEIQYFYQAGDICMVTSLHDGMNLVAKEYVWCQSPERGSLILSRFTGASRELTEALIVNPYSIEEMADAIATALSMPAEERARRMRAMKEKVSSRNAFHWAGDLIEALATEVKPATTSEPLAPPAGLTSERRARGGGLRFPRIAPTPNAGSGPSDKSR